MAATTFSDQIEMLRVRLETSVPLPVVLCLSSALDDDGKGVVAAGVARSMHAAGYSTLLLLANDKVLYPTTSVQPPKSLGDIADNGLAPYLDRGPRVGLRTMVLPSEGIRHSASRESVARFAAQCRSEFSVTIIEAGDLLTNSFAMLAAVAANGVVVTFREGRRVTALDRRLAEVLAREEAKFLGVVSVAASVISSKSTALALRPVQGSKIATVGGETAPKREGQPV